MRISEPDYHWYLEEFCAAKTLVRQLNECLVYSADPLLIILEDPMRNQVARFSYDTPSERERDIALVLNIKDDDGGSGALFPALIDPDIPPRSFGNAKEFPQF